MEPQGLGRDEWLEKLSLVDQSLRRQGARAELTLVGSTLDEAAARIPACAQIAAKAADPIDDVRTTASYRRIIVDVFLQRCAQDVLNTLKNGGGN